MGLVVCGVRLFKRCSRVIRRTHEPATSVRRSFTQEPEIVEVYMEVKMGMSGGGRGACRNRHEDTLLWGTRKALDGESGICE
jgi:hypothetical protein